MTNQEIDPNSDPHGLVTGYILDILDAEELQRFTAHLDDCPYCQQAISEMTETIAELASSSHVVPPQAVEDRLMASLFGQAPASEAVAAADATEADDGQSQGPAEVLAQPITLHSRRRWVWPAAAAAAFILGAALVTTMGLGHAHDSGQLAADGQTQLVLALAAAPDAQSMPLNLPKGDATVVVSAGLNQAAVTATDLPAPPAGQKYHVWTVHSDGTVASAGTFTPDAAGNASIMLNTHLNDASGFAVTVDDPSLTQPTSAPISEVTF